MCSQNNVTIPYNKLYLKEVLFSLAQKLNSSKFLYTPKIDWEMKQYMKFITSSMKISASNIIHYVYGNCAVEYVSQRESQCLVVLFEKSLKLKGLCVHAVL